MSEKFEINLEALNEAFREFVPHNKALGLTLIEAEPGVATMRLEYDARWVGNPETGVLHGGVITTLVDATCGAAVFLRLQSSTPIATLDLRLDYLKPAVPHRAVFARAECFKTTHNVAFVRAIAFQDSKDDLIASAAGTFMLSTQGQAVTEAAKG